MAEEEKNEEEKNEPSEEKAKPREAESDSGEEQAKPEEKVQETTKEEKKIEEKLPTESRGPSTQNVGAKPEPQVKEKVKDEPITVETKVDKEVKVPAKFKKLVDEIEKMSIMDLAELVKILEKKFGVSPVVAATAPTAVGAPTEAGEEKSEFTIELKDAGKEKIQVIRVVREITGKGLKEAKDLVDAAPKVVKENVKKEEAEEIKDKFEKAGATVELK